MRKNVTPKDELLLAKLIQNARVRGLESSVGTYYRNEAGDYEHRFTKRVKYCCALGAALLEADTKEEIFLPRMEAVKEKYYNIVKGNDGPGWWKDEKADDGESLGWAFNEALSDF